MLCFDSLAIHFFIPKGLLSILRGLMLDKGFILGEFLMIVPKMFLEVAHNCPIKLNQNHHKSQNDQKLQNKR